MMNTFLIQQRTGIALFLMLSSIPAYTQKLKDKLQGDWVCTQILDAQGKSTVGKFGPSDEYLRFSFAKTNITISEAPFDRGLKIPISYGNDYIEQAPGSPVAIPEKKYTIVSVDSAVLILKTFNKTNEPIEYHFANQRLLGNMLPPEDIILDFGTIYIKHIRLKEDKNSRIKVIGTRKVYEYRISNAPGHLFPSPIFSYPPSPILGANFSYDIKLPEIFTAGETVNDMVIAFEVDKSGAENLRVVQGLHPELDVQIIKLMEETRKHWNMLMLSDKPVRCTVMLHFGFILIVE